MTIDMRAESSPDGLYIVLISIHGLIRDKDLELGRDADTGGQTLYVVELAKALGELPAVARVDLLTRLVDDNKVSDSYKQAETRLNDCAQIVRIPCGPRRYLRKEVLWRHLDCFADNALRYIRSTGVIPDVIHSHYADAGYVGTRLAGLMEVPLLHTGHSLGRVKHQRLQEKGLSEEAIEKRYNIQERIEAEEQTLEAASVVIASTQQEVDEQYALYDQYRPERMRVIAPGTDLSRFYPPSKHYAQPAIQAAIDRFLDQPNKPMILALARPDERKNLLSLVDAYGQSCVLQQVANLVIVAGNRDDIDELDTGAKKVWTGLLKRIDRYDLYGKVAYPKHHAANDVPELYRLAVQRKGVFINPALTEPFGLTLIEAAACGLPLVATNDGGPRDILANCQNGELIDPLDIKDIQHKLMGILQTPQRWQTMADNGLAGAAKHYAWESHAQQYLGLISGVAQPLSKGKAGRAERMVRTSRLLTTDIDDTLLGGAKPDLSRLLKTIEQYRVGCGFAVATGRGLRGALGVLDEWDVPTPDILITGVGTEIYYGPNLAPDLGWQNHIDYRWDREAIAELLRELPGLHLQARSEQSDFKLSFNVNASAMPAIDKLRALLRHHDLHANLIYSKQRYLDVLPLRASKGQAVRYCADKWHIDLERVLVCGDSGNDVDMMTGRTLGVVVANATECFPQLQGLNRVYFAEQPHAAGILEAIEYYDFFGSCDVPASSAQQTHDLAETTGEVA